MAQNSPAPDAIRVFDRALLRRRRRRAAGNWPAHDFLKREAVAALRERLDDIRHQFPRLLDLGSHAGELSDALQGRAGEELTVRTDLAPRFLARQAGLCVVADEEFLPFAPASFDLIASALSLHWVNDLPGALLQIRQALKPDGLFLAAMLGGSSLYELRQCLLQAEAEFEGGASPRVSPFVDLRDAAGLLQRAGFALPVADIDRLNVTYADALALMRELRGMGESNVVLERRRTPMRRQTLLRAAALYADRFGQPDGRITATFEIIYLHAWAPHASQQQPLRPGSAQQRLAEALGVVERSAGEKAGH
ncbi:MAG: SAM-dependent methyltransferase [Alphaproteobacteria bacterium]|nr:SAM-dependent methyltransferase [Alphaproteobacteria bacterium]